MKTFTDTVRHAVTDGRVYAEIFAPDVDPPSCATNMLDDTGNDFKSGAEDIFDEAILGTCKNFEIGGQNIQVKLRESTGDDDWMPQKVTIETTSYAYVCSNSAKAWVKDQEKLTLNCIRENI